MSSQTRRDEGKSIDKTEDEQGLPASYQEALVETGADLDIVTELMRPNLSKEDVSRVLRKLATTSLPRSV